MSQIAYDPVKDKFAGLIRRSRVLRSLFYSLLDLFFLRSWYIRSRLRSWYGREVVQVEKSDSRLCILDAGCGFGQYDRFMLHAFPGTRIDAVDVKQDYLQDCTHFFRGDIDAGQITFTQMDLLSPSLSKSYHLVLCVDVLEHIVEDVRVMRNMQQVLKPGGYFLMHSPSHLAEDDADGDESFVGEHARAGYSREELSDKFRAAGLEPVDIRYTYGWFGHTAWVMLIKWPMLWLTRLGFAAVVVLPFWYALTLLPGLLLMSLDMVGENRKGTGIMGFARKPAP
ncbi:MAG: Methyltransferase domain [Bacteroidetes bacterium HLUCCA01]|nr:MAG: Methyltransferase domain [Bacteroidetes bacterium HLUCCA01]